MFLVVPDDTCIAEPFWDPRTPGPVGIINCFGESSPFEIDYQCAYECPSSNDNLCFANNGCCIIFSSLRDQSDLILIFVFELLGLRCALLAPLSDWKTQTRLLKIKQCAVPCF